MEDNRRKGKKKHGLHNRRVTIPVELRQFIKFDKGDFIEWEVDTVKKTLKGKLIIDDAKKKIVTRKLK